MLVLACCAAVGATLLLLTVPRSATRAKVACSPAALVDAINSANASPNTDTLELQKGCDYQLSSRNNTGFGPTGLPVITTKTIILGAGATIHRTGGNAFRLFAVDVTGSLELRDLTLRDGLAQGGGGGSGAPGEGGAGGGGAGVGGAIYNRGILRSRAHACRQRGTGRCRRRGQRRPLLRRRWGRRRRRPGRQRRQRHADCRP